MSLENLNLSLEKSPNSTLEFGEISKLNPWVWRILQTQPLSVCVFLNFVFFPKKMSLEILNLSWEKSPNSPLSLEKSPNSTLEFGEFSKLNLWVCVFFKFRFFSKKGWVWRFLQPEFGEISKLNLWVCVCFLNFVFFKKMSLEISPNSDPWVWRILQTQGLSLEISPNSNSKETKSENMFIFQKPKWVWRILQTQVLSLENSANSDSKEFFLSLENFPNSRVEFGELSKLKGWVEFGDFLQTQGLNSESKEKISDFFLKMHLENSQKVH